MGFKKSNVLKEIPVTFSVEVIDEITGDTTRATVTHVFKRPTPSQRERLTEVYMDQGNKKRKTSFSSEVFRFWEACIMRVEGYDDLNDQDLTIYFSDPIGREHVEAAIGLLISKLSVEEEVEIKKFEE